MPPYNHTQEHIKMMLVKKRFQDTYRCREDGKFIVRLPLNQDPAALGKSENMAVQRFQNVGKRLMKNPALRSSYVDFMHEYKLLGHMSKIDSTKLHSG